MNFYNDMVYLSFCALKDQTPQINRLENMDFDKLFKICQMHKITALVCYALEKVMTPDPKWLEAKGKAIRKNMLMDLERNRILAFMEKKGIKYMPLKGVLIKDYYPALGMREMADNDIYFDGMHREEIEKFMRDIGYEDVKHTPNNDEYKRQPFYNFELHYALFSKEDSELFSKYYADMDKFFKKDEDNGYGYHFSKEDFYVYFIAHEYKHFCYGGTGVRSFFDVGVLLEKFSNTYDWEYIKAQTEKLEITAFEVMQRNLWAKLFDDIDTDKLTKSEVEVLECFVRAGAFGSGKIVIEKSVEEKIKEGEKSGITKGKYVLKRLFPPIEYYKEPYPFLYRYKIFIPFFVVYRFLKMLFKRNYYVKTEIDVLKKRK